MDGLKLKPGKCGCEGCFYEHNHNCPGDETLDNCIVDGTAMIFVKEQDDE